MIYIHSFQYYINRFFHTRYSYKLIPIKKSKHDRIVIFKKLPLKHVLYMNLYRIDNIITKKLDSIYFNWRPVFIYLYNCIYYYFGIDFDIFDIKNKQQQFPLGHREAFTLLSLIDDYSLNDYSLRNETKALSDDKTEALSEDKTKDEKIVWTMWWQNEKPPLVDYVLNNRIIPKGYKQIIISEENYKKYITIPEYILKLVKNKLITITQLSDYMRMSLVSKYGGCWLDSTVLLTKELPNFQKDLEKIGLWHPKSNFLRFLSKDSFNGWMFFANKNQPCIVKMKQLFERYYRMFDINIHYFVIDMLYKHILKKHPQYCNFVTLIHCNEGYKYGFYKLSYKRRRNVTVEQAKKLLLKDNPMKNNK